MRLHVLFSPAGIVLPIQPRRLPCNRFLRVFSDFFVEPFVFPNLHLFFEQFKHEFDRIAPPLFGFGFKLFPHGRIVYGFGRHNVSILICFDAVSKIFLNACKRNFFVR